MNCEAGERSFTCEAWPQSVDDQLTYTWTKNGGLTFAYPTGSHDPFKQVNCGTLPSGTLTVKVTSPYGLSSQTSVTLNCNGN